MFRNDWFMREIDNLSNAISEVVFHKQRPKLEMTFEQYNFDRERLWKELMAFVGKGEIGKAEDVLYANIDTNNYDMKELACEFYEHLDSLDDDFLNRCGFPREEIKRGAEDFIAAWKRATAEASS